MDLVLYTLRSLAYIIIEPSLLLILVILGVMFYLKNKKLAFMQKMVTGESINSPLELTLSQITLGLIGGIFASLMLSILGVVFKENSGIELLFIISIISIFFKTKLTSFAYAGGIIGALSIVVTYFNIGGDSNSFLKLDISSLIIFIGIIHIIQGFLIMIDGSKGAIPAFSKKNNRLIGGYVLNRSWAIPITLFIALSSNMNSDIINNNISTPGWWPIFSNSSTLNLISTAILGMIPLFGLVSYNTATFTKTKRGKSISSGIYIVIYGIVISLISIIAEIGLAGKIIAIILVPLLYVAVIRFERMMEDKKEPIFYSDEHSICVLEVVPFSKAYSAGIKVGDRIISIEGKDIESEKQIYQALKDNHFDVEIEIKSKSESRKKVRVGKGKGAGMLLVPRFVDEDKKIEINKKRINEILEKIKDEQKSS
ncbi:PDZ domain-containing protein [Clostridium sardiniense]|uniref:PDZ domain-containing protein n=1 Tax=Clostridium sardiniense TaxID=29369 RepID=UPI00195814E2|nr:PDZ domain-containing protein [Clostridium sardiniense]MBM7833900.1 hypothetical protein [Clostridium sardiniense]